jgi:diguanylate cyclase (GGDEF)-like protein
MAAALSPDLVLLDVDMPEPNGFEVCRRLRLIESLGNTPIIFLTSASSTEEKIRGLELGAVDYITKPFDPAELRARVRAALRLKFMIDLLAKKAQIDALTGLWNRRHFDNRLEGELSLSRRSGRPLAILMLDVDHFKSINDRFGHPMGDEVLRRIGLFLVEAVRQEDVVCRYGGEEFAIVIPNGSEGSVDLAERLRTGIEKLHFTCNGQPLTVTVSIGLAASDQPDEALLEQADAALYRAKQSGRNRVAVTSNLPPVPATAVAAA